MFQSLDQQYKNVFDNAVEAMVTINSKCVIQSANETINKEGTGLGIPLSRGLIEAHGGKILATNRAEGGAHFEISLPS